MPLEWLYAALGALGGSTLTVFVCQRLIGRFIDKKFSDKEAESMLRLQRFALIEKRLDVYATLFKRIIYGIRQFKKHYDKQGLVFWNGELEKAVDEFYMLEKEIDEYNRKLRNEKG